MPEDFHTFNEYMKKENENLTASMEDYLEMIYRQCSKYGYTRINELAEALNVQPPSATKMVQKLSELKFINYEKYGIILLTDEGRRVGGSLLKRHNTIDAFLRILGIREGILEETEKLEHTISFETVERMDSLMEFIKEKDGLLEEFYEFHRNKKER